MEQENIFQKLEITNTETAAKVADIQIREAKTKVKNGKKTLNFWVEQLLYSKAKELFDKNQNLDYITWTQYTNYFNDGEPCYFSIQPLRFRLKDQEKILEEFDYDEISIENYQYPDGFRELEEYQDLINQIDIIDTLLHENQPTIKRIFGDHAEISINHKGNLEVTDFSDHD